MTKDIDISTEGLARKRIKLRLRETELRKLVARKTSQFQQLVAIATYRAEERRANSEQRDVIEEVAKSGFECSPWKWDVQGRQSHSEVAFLWTWQTRDGTLRKAFVFQRLNNVFVQGLPRPPDLCETDADLFRQLLEIAVLEKRSRKAPCKYLGVHIGKGRYEQNPCEVAIAVLQRCQDTCDGLLRMGARIV